MSSYNEHITHSEKPRIYHAPQGSKDADDDDMLIDIRAILLMFWRRKYVIFSIVLIGMSLSFMVLSVIDKKYTARSVVLVEGSMGQQRIPEELNLFMNNVFQVNSSVVLNELEIIRSRNMARKVIDRLELLTDPEFNPSYRQSLEKYAPELLNSKQSFKSFNIYQSEMDNIPPELVDYQLNTTITNFLNNLDLRTISGSFAIQIQYTSKDPAKAALIANTVADVYIDERLQQKFEAGRKITDWLDQRLKELREQVREAEYAVARYQAENNLTQGIRNVLSAEQVSQINSQLINAKAQKVEVEARLEQIETIMRGNGSLETSSDIVQVPFIRDLRSTESALLTEYKELSKRYGERHPRMVALTAELENVQEKIQDEMRKVVLSMENEVAVAKTRVEVLEEGLAELKDVRNVDNEKMIRLNELMREAESNRLIMENFMQTYKRSDEQEELQEPGARVLSFAVVPTKPSYPDHLLILSLSLALSLFLGLLLSLLLEKLDNKFRSASQLEKYCGYPCFALIPAVKNMTQPQLAQLVLDKPSSTLAEAVRTLRTVLYLRGKKDGEKPKVLTMTSSFPGEGKTTLSVWLARLAAKSGDKVILIDGDLRRPNVHKTLQKNNDLSLIDYLTDKADLKDVIKTDDDSGLHTIFAKSVPNSALDLISSDKMRTLIEALKQEYDFIIIDSPACLAVLDARILATYSDQTLYAVAWDRTPREVVAGGVKQFSDIGYDSLAFTLTNVDVKRHVRYGYGDTVYYYGNYQES
ncbi:MAG: GumC family protein [Alphaproteobacteria bacterium]